MTVVDEQAKETSQEVGGQVEDTTDTASQDAAPRTGSTIGGELKAAVREAALEVLRPVARDATKSAARLAVTKGPSLVKGKVGGAVTEKVAEAGGAGEMVKAVATKGGSLKDKLPLVGGRGGGRAATGTGRGRRLPVQEHVDVAVPVQVAYDQYTQFEDFPQFMHRVEKVEQRDDTTLMWHENIWGVRRSWEAEITEQTPCERIAWRSKGGPETVGVVTFHELAPRLTRVYVTMDFQPKGLLEKSASGTRVSRRALKSDLMRFKAYVELRDDATGAWRGRIEDGEVVDAPEDEPQDRGEPEEAEDRGHADAERGAEAEAAYDDEEPEDAYDEEPEAADEEEPEPAAEDRPGRRRERRFSRADDEPEAGYEEEDDEDEDEPAAAADAEEDRPRRRSRAAAPSTEDAPRRRRSKVR